MESHLMRVAPRPDLVVVRGEGSYLWDERGARYLDFVQGWAVNSLGHAPTALARAIADQAATLVHASPAFHTRVQLDYAEAIVRAGALDRVFFCSTGAEANEGAIKLVRRWASRRRPGAFEILTAEGSFHGRTLATMAASGKPGFDGLFPPSVPGFRKVPYGDLAVLEAAITDRTAAVMLEPIQGEAGVVVPPASYLRAVRELTEQRGVLLVLDEIQTGMGRTGALFRFETERIEPDVLTLGKGIGGGVPLAALCARESVSCFERGDQGGTYPGNALMMAAGHAVLKEVTAPGFLEGVRARGEELRAGLSALASKHGHVEVRGAGLLLALSLREPNAAEVVEHARDAGLLLNAPREDLLRFMPALNVTSEEIQACLALLESVLSTLEGSAPPARPDGG
jgi:acetylornithine/N-succinyldiaminopimelate aminotransferase